MIELVRRVFDWQGLTRDVTKYLKACVTCIRSKPSHLKKTGLLVPLEIPEHPWSSVSVDFIVELPLSNGFDAVMVVVDRFTKMSYFIPCNTTITSVQTARLFVDRIFALHGIPLEIVSDRGPQFTAQFWEKFTLLLGIKLCCSTAFNPQSDCQTERVNQVLETYLCCYSNAEQNDWASNLPIAQFSYNNSPMLPMERRRSMLIMVMIPGVTWVLRLVQWWRWQVLKLPR